MFGIMPGTLSHRIAIGKILGLVIGLVGVGALPFVYPQAGWNLYVIVFVWYATVGAIIGMAGVYDHYPVFKIPGYRLIRGASIGGWLNLLLIVFAWEDVRGLMLDYFGPDGMLQSPLWGVVEGMIVGAILDLFMTKISGDGPMLVKREFPD